ncbi:unnamed protein product [Cylindrotheca closterium]|uniref:CCHC-type domain-containing protein n=1 Tax=Cylindrotheca closterium TaxID=2856 RepID=A0AAD2CNE0_9STRA|nr:unnamed protein product [Cylindrotheca closterium]
MDAETDAAKIKEDEEISEVNIKAFSDLMISMNTDTAEGKVAFNLVAGSRDKVNYPKGNAKEAWDKLKDEYEPKTITSYIKMKSKLNKCHLEKFANPASWITELSKICVRLEEMKHPVSEEDQFIHIIGSLPLKYRQEQKDFEKMMKANTLTIKYIKEELNSAHEDFANATEGDDDDEDKEDKDVALVTGQFKGNCNNCGKYGHKKLTCPELTQATRQGGERKQNNGGRHRYNGGGRGAFLGTCFHCGIRGHKKHECRRNPENRNNGTTGNNGNNNNSNNNDDDDDDVAEVMLMATETLIAPAEPTQKKNFWFEWNEECEESDCEDEEVDDEVIVHTIVEDPNDKVHEHGNFLHDDFFDNFMANFGQNDCDAKNDETFHATKPTSEYAFVTEEIEIKRYSDVDGSGTYNSDGDEIPQLVERTMKAKHYASDEWDHNNRMPEYNSDSDDSDDDDIPPPLVSRHGVVHGHDEVSLIGRHDNISDDDLIYDEIPQLIARQQHYSDHDDSDDDDSDDDDDNLIHTNDEPYYDGDGDDESTVQTETSIQDEINLTRNGIAMANMDKWKSEEMKLTPQTWFGDSAASTHMCNDDTNLYDYDVIREEIKVGSGKTIVATKIGKLKLRVKQTNGKVIMMVLTKVKFVPELWCNLFSLTAAMDKGFDLGNHHSDPWIDNYWI